MNESSRRATALLEKMRKQSTEEIFREYLPEVIRKAEHSDPYGATPGVVRMVLQERGIIPTPPERPSERAMRLAAEERQRVEGGRGTDVGCPPE